MAIDERPVKVPCGDSRPALCVRGCFGPATYRWAAGPAVPAASVMQSGYVYEGIPRVYTYRSPLRYTYTMYILHVLWYTCQSACREGRAHSKFASSRTSMSGEQPLLPARRLLRSNASSKRPLECSSTDGPWDGLAEPMNEAVDAAAAQQHAGLDGTRKSLPSQ